MKKLLILLTILSATYSVSDTNISNTNNTSIAKTKYCKNMSTCKEAMFYFEVCEDVSLDRDKDGIPCENVCK